MLIQAKTLMVMQDENKNARSTKKKPFIEDKGNKQTVVRPQQDAGSFHLCLQEYINTATSSSGKHREFVHASLSAC
jgi:hypothetical protein